MEFDTQEEHDKHHQEVHEVNIPQEEREKEKNSISDD